MNAIKRPKRSPKNHPVRAFDGETLGPDRKFVCGGYHDEEGCRFTTDKEELRGWLLDPSNGGAVVYATNLFYDFTAIFGGFPAPAKALFSGARLISVRWPLPDKRTIRFFDTSNLTNRLSVASLGAMVGLAKLPTPACLVDPSGSDLSDWMDHPGRMAEVEMYCRRDTTITYRWALRFQALCKEIGCEVKTTIASTGLDLWKRRYMAKGLFTPPKWMNEYLRPGYHGGLVMVFRRGFAKGVSYYDIHSLYPHVLSSREYPDITSMVWTRGRSKIDYITRYEGFTRCRVDNPDSYLPLLPVVVGSTMTTVTGVIEGWWTHIELREAMARGTEILEILDQVYFTRTCRPLARYMEELYRLRTMADQQKESFGSAYKLLMNALSGKFGQRMDNELYEPVDVDSLPPGSSLDGMTCIAGGAGDVLIRPVVMNHTPDFVCVPWAAYMTAYARLEEIRHIEQALPDVYACDTDSVFTAYEYELSDELGAMGLKAPAADWVFLYPKQYGCWDDDGNWHGRLKGVPVVGQAEYFRQGSYTWSKPSTFKEAARDGGVPGDWVERTRTDLPKHDKRLYLHDIDPWRESTDSRPFTYEEAIAYYSYPPPPDDWRVTGYIAATDPYRMQRRKYDEWQVRQELSTLKESCTIPPTAMMRLWDYRRGQPRRVRDRSGTLTTWEYAVADDMAGELGYADGQDLIGAVERQASTYVRIRELRRML